MLSQMAFRPLFSGGLPVFSFLISALAAGLGLGLLVFKDTKQLQEWMKVALIANLTLVLAEVLTGLLTGSGEIALVFFGSAAPGFWFHLIVGIALPLWLLYAERNQDLVGGLVIAGVLAEKVWMLEAGQAIPMLELPMESYTATWVEYLALLGAVALAVLLYLLYQKFIPKRKAE
jgi:Ni/Fe-hydrogenase subunit HybB-like protein